MPKKLSSSLKRFPDKYTPEDDEIPAEASITYEILDTEFLLLNNIRYEIHFEYPLQKKDHMQISGLS